MKETLRLILGDQLNIQHSWYEKVQPNVIYCLFEMRPKPDDTIHHIQKVMGYFAAKRAFAADLEAKGHRVFYYKINDERNAQNLLDNLWSLIYELDIVHFEYQLPDEYELDKSLKRFCKEIPIPSQSFDTEHFLTSRTFLAEFFEGEERYTMEYFYREMRRKYNILMTGNQPYLGTWKYEEERKKRMSKEHWPPKPLRFKKDLTALYEEIINSEIQTIGKVNPASFIWPTSRKESLQLLEHFTENCLRLFGTFQDAMTPKFWSIYHSRLSFSLNTKMLHPLEVVQRILEYWSENQDDIKLQQVEAFIRKIIGWREFVRGIYWAKMPEYQSLNFFEHKGDLPKMFETGETKMACLKHAFFQTENYAYAHHAQKLILLGNFALLTGCAPKKVEQWFRGRYIDATEWATVVNTHGISQFADKGITVSKPFIAGSKYVNKMSLYCNDCHYSNKLKFGNRACPFNTLFLNFLNKHQTKLNPNPRMGMIYRSWHKTLPSDKKAILEQAEEWLEKIDEV